MSKLVGAVLIVAAVAISADRVLQSVNQTAENPRQLQDLSQIVAANDPNNPKDARKITTSSELGNLLKEFTIKIQDRDSELEKDLARFSIDDALLWETISTKDGRKESLSLIDQNYRCFSRYTTDVIMLRKEFLDSVRGKAGSATQKFALRNEQDQKLLKARRFLYDRYVDVIRTVESSTVVKQDGELVFKHDAQHKKYLAAMDRATVAEESLDRMAQKVLKDLEQTQKEARQHLAAIGG